MEKRVNKKGTVSYWENGVMVMKECTKCKVIKGVESFNKRKSGLHHHCKEKWIETTNSGKRTLTWVCCLGEGSCCH